MRGTTALAVAVFALGLSLGSNVMDAADSKATPPAPVIPEFTAGFLNDPKNLAAGKELWDDQCSHCHGRNAYPGKAPKLKPRKYSPDFVYDRLTYGFRKMPAWEDAYSENERMQIVAYIMSKSFSP
ncbi:MAG: cytochrome c [Pseudomonadota bacterium]